MSVLPISAEFEKGKHCVYNKLLALFYVQLMLTKSEARCGFTWSTNHLQLQNFCNFTVGDSFRANTKLTILGIHFVMSEKKLSDFISGV